MVQLPAIFTGFPSGIRVVPGEVPYLSTLVADQLAPSSSYTPSPSPLPPAGALPKVTGDLEEAGLDYTL